MVSDCKNLARPIWFLRRPVHLQFFRIGKNHAQPGRIVCNERLANAPHMGDVSRIDEVSVKAVDAPIPICEIGSS